MDIRILLTATAMAATPLVAAAQDDIFDDDRRYEWSARAMATWLNTDDLGDAWGGMVGVGFQPLDWFSAEIRAGYLRADDESMDIIPVEGVAMFRVPNIDTIEPYAGVGVGHYFLESDDISTDDPQAIFPLIGLDVRLPETRLRLFAEVRYMFFDGSVSDDLESSDMNGIGANLGVTWTF
jgi:hypothetical protein